LIFSHREKDRQKVQKGKKKEKKGKSGNKSKISSNSSNGSRNSTARRRMENGGEDCDDQSADSRFPTGNLDKKTKNRKKKSHARVCVCVWGCSIPFRRAREKSGKRDRAS
jgi:hypothetical protein